MTNAVDRAAEIVAAFFGPDDSPADVAEALAAADPPLLVTDEIQAVLDAVLDAVNDWVRGRGGGMYVLTADLADAINAYLDSRGDL